MAPTTDNPQSWTVTVDGWQVACGPLTSQAAPPTCAVAMLETGESARDLGGFVLPESGGLVQTAGPARPYLLPIFVELQGCGCPSSTVRSYGMDLLRWCRFLERWGLVWIG
ncbi:hypothetical protein [Streptomyces roseoviridis]|uniref:Uncharacterized protein n=1 Tax=Streptomyces roseoviridis TaxID=67361 RepID=A0ABV5QXU4_9ACTN